MHIREKQREQELECREQCSGLFLAISPSVWLRHWYEEAFPLGCRASSQFQQAHSDIITNLVSHKYNFNDITALYTTFTNISLLARNNFNCHQLSSLQQQSLSCSKHLQKELGKNVCKSIFTIQKISKREFLLISKRQLRISRDDNKQAPLSSSWIALCLKYSGVSILMSTRS